MLQRIDDEPGKKVKQENEWTAPNELNGAEGSVLGANVVYENAVNDADVAAAGALTQDYQNAVIRKSPAFTCHFAFPRYLRVQLEDRDRDPCFFVEMKMCKLQFLNLVELRNLFFSFDLKCHFNPDAFCETINQFFFSTKARQGFFEDTTASSVFTGECVICFIV